MIELLPSSVLSVTNIWSFLAIVCIVAALVVVRLKAHRFKELLKRIDKLPETDRLKAIKEELDQVPPPNLSAEQYIKFKSQPYNFTFKCLIALLIAGLIVMTLSTLLPRPTPFHG